MKIATITCLLFCAQLHAQTPIERIATITVKLDTTLTPDYYSVSVIVAERVNVEWVSKKNIKRTIIPLDTMKQRFVSELRSLGFNQSIDEEKITEIREDNYGYLRDESSIKLFQLTMNFVVHDRDSATLLFNKINKEPLRSLMIEPGISKEREEQVRKMIDHKAKQQLDSLVKALAVDQKINITKTTFGSVIYDGGNINRNWSGNNKFLLDLKLPVYQFSGYCTYSYHGL